ncbi:MAG: 50S ribosomal protein L6 [Treponema sp.]|jgi:large subunit ribosomal protein L6|nr:50S ribosomal protein L6 [Treponema sp.]
MSRIGKIPVKIPMGVKVDFRDDIIFVEGPKGKLHQKYPPVVSFEESCGDITVSRANDEKQTKAFHGLYRNLLSNMVIGVSTGFSKTLIVAGVGYKAEVRDKLLVLSLGYSNDIYVYIPDGISVTVEAGGKLVIAGIDKQIIGEFATEIRKLRVPEPYKGKGIRYETERIKLKPGKSGKSGVK